MNRERERRPGATVATAEPPDASQQLEQPVFIDELADVLGTSRRTIQKMRRARSFPIPELPPLDRRPRWSRAAVRTWLAEGRVGHDAHGTSRPRLVQRKGLGEVFRKGGGR